MSVVVDSSPLIYLAAVSHFELLRLYFSEILIPEAVYQEVVAVGGERHGAYETREGLNAGWIRIVEPADEQEVASLLRRGMTRADAHVVALAQEIQADLVICDDGMVRAQAQSRGLPVSGVIGILLRGKLSDRLPSLKEVLDRLIQIGFYLDPDGRVYEQVLRQAGEI